MNTESVIATMTSSQGQTSLDPYEPGPVHLFGTQNGLFERHLLYDIVTERTAADSRDRFEAFAHAVRDLLSHLNPKRIYYLSMEFLIGRSLAYIGTHDNNTTRGWFEALPEQQKQAFAAHVRHIPLESSHAAPELMRLAWSSSAGLAIAPLQDLLNLGASARMNTPGQASGNWRWRITDDMLSPAAFEWLRDVTRKAKRCPADLPRAESEGLQQIEVTR